MPIFKPRNTKRAQKLRREATPMERKLWRCLSRSQLGAKFSRQMQVGDYFADFLCRKWKLIIEVDGWSHDVAPERGMVRDAYLEGEGYRVLHFSNAEVGDNIEGVVAAIKLALRPPRYD